MISYKRRHSDDIRATMEHSLTHLLLETWTLLLQQVLLFHNVLRHDDFRDEVVASVALVDEVDSHDDEDEVDEVVVGSNTKILFYSDNKSLYTI